jgi:hypothetical protein
LADKPEVSFNAGKFCPPDGGVPEYFFKIFFRKLFPVLRGEVQYFGDG